MVPDKVSARRPKALVELERGGYSDQPLPISTEGDVAMVEKTIHIKTNPESMIPIHTNIEESVARFERAADDIVVPSNITPRKLKPE